MKSYDVIVIGAGHNGLIVASKLAASGRSVLLLEASETYGGMARSEVLFEGFQAPEFPSTRFSNTGIPRLKIFDAPKGPIWPRIRGPGPGKQGGS